MLTYLSSKNDSATSVALRKASFQIGEIVLGDRASSMNLAQRLKEARMSMKLTQQDVATKLGISRPAVTQWESGQTAPDPTNLAKLSDIYGVPVDDLAALLAPGDAAMVRAASRGLTGTEPRLTPPEPSTVDLSRIVPIPAISTMPRDVPILGVAVGGDDADFEFNGQIVDYVRRPPGLMGVSGAFGVYVIGSSMWPRYEEGDLVYIHPGRPAKPGDDVIVEMYRPDGESGFCYIKRLLKKTPTKLVCQQYNPMRDDLKYDLERIKMVHKIMRQDELMSA